MPCTISNVVCEQIFGFITCGFIFSTTFPLREMRSTNCGRIIFPLLATAL